MLHAKLREALAEPIPSHSVFEFPPVEELSATPVRIGLKHWRASLDGRAFPARKDLQLRPLANVLPYMSVARVIDGGSDFEYRFMGDVQVRAFSGALHNRRFSEIAREHPRLIEVGRPMYMRVVESRAPLGMRGRSGHDASPMVAFTKIETIFLPLGNTEDAVDHVASFCAFASGGLADGM